MLQYSAVLILLRTRAHAQPVSSLPLAPARGVGTVGVSGFLCCWLRDQGAPGGEKGTTGGVALEQPWSVQPAGDEPSPLPLGMGNAQRQRSCYRRRKCNRYQKSGSRILCSPCPPSAQGPLCGQLPRATEFGAGGLESCSHQAGSRGRIILAGSL